MMPVVWLSGTSGVGKSTAGHGMLRAMAERGVTAAFVDADQVRLAAGAPAEETELVASGLAALAPRYQEAGARLLLVAGLVDGPGHLARLLPGADRERILLWHLSADATTLRERIHRRGWAVERADEAVAYAERVDTGSVDLHLDTGGMTRERVVDHLAAVTLERLGPVLAEAAPSEREADTARSDGRVLLVTGPGGVGTSTIGFGVFSRMAREGNAVAYVDTRQLGLVGADPHGRHLSGLRADNARALIGTLTAGGARTIVVGADPDTALTLGDEAESVVLRARPETLEERLRLRSEGVGPPLSGDPRKGIDEEALRRAITESVEEGVSIEARLPKARTLSTDGVEPSALVETVLEARDEPGPR